MEKGFSRSNLNYMRLFYQRFPICEELPNKLTWTHHCLIVKIYLRELPSRASGTAITESPVIEALETTVGIQSN